MSTQTVDLIPDLIPEVEELLGSFAPFTHEERLDFQHTMRDAVEVALEIPLEDERVVFLEYTMYSVTNRLLSRRFSLAA